MILNKIVKHKREEVKIKKEKVSFQELEKTATEMPPTKSFYQALKEKEQVSLIAEVKKASPSKGIIREDFDPVEIARIYTANGASAISVLTDEKFFQGSPDYLKAIRQATDLPLLRKDFIIDPYQIYEARCLGADTILLIAAILDDNELVAFHKQAVELGLQCLVEVHTKEELARVINTDARIIGINNRDLNTFKTDLQTTFYLRKIIRDSEIAVVSESGINTYNDVERLKENNVDAMLVGEALVREKDIAVKVGELLGKVV